MAAMTDLPTVERLVELFRHLGIERAHLAGSGLEAAALAVAHPELVASVTLVCPSSAATERLRALGRRPGPAAPTLFVCGDRGPLVEAVPRVRGDLPDATVLTLADYAGALWSDPIADRADEVGPALFGFLADASARGRVAPIRPASGDGELAGVTYRVRGGGPPLVLFPLGLAASQWDPLVPVLADHYCTVTLSGASIGVVARVVGGAGRG
jgi:pimeloyl-ACP methyl ester carboxylesterase